MTDSEKERLERIQNKIEQMKIQERAIIIKDKKRQQRENTHRLIQNGKLAEKYFRCENMKSEEFEGILKSAVELLNW